MNIDLVTTSDEDRRCNELIREAFEQAVREAEDRGCPFCGKRFPLLGNLELDPLLESLLEALGVSQ